MFSFFLLLIALFIPSRGADFERVILERGSLANGAAIVVHRQPGVPVVSLRMSVLTPDPAGYSGAGHMIQHMIYPALAERAARVGGSVRIQRTADAIVYTATGPATELAHLAEILTSALTRPTAPLDAVLRAERELREERLAEWETAPAHTRSLLRAQLFPADLSAAGNDRSSTRFSVSTMGPIWTDMYSPDRVSIVAVGDVYLSDVEAAFAGIPEAYEPRRLGIDRDSVVLMSLAPAQATRAWLGAGYQATDLPPAAVTVVTRLLGDALREQLPGAQVDAEHWWTHHGQAVVLVVAVPASQQATTRDLLVQAIPTLLTEIDADLVEDAALAAGREMLFYARTPDGMAEVLGQFIDRDGDPEATQEFYAGLEALTEDDVRSALRVLRDRPPARVVIPPQTLRPRR